MKVKIAHFVIFCALCKNDAIMLIFTKKSAPERIPDADIEETTILRRRWFISGEYFGELENVLGKTQ